MDSFMQRIAKQQLFFLSVLIFSFSSFAKVSVQKKVLILGIDGCRPDALIKAKTPHIDKLLKFSAYSIKAQTQKVPLSGPSWSSLLTGVSMKKHKVKNNSFSGHQFHKYPHFFKHVKSYDKNLVTGSIIHWAPINRHIVSHSDIKERYSSDEIVAEQVVEALKSKGNQSMIPDVLFVHFDEVDITGHSSGFSPNNIDYIDSIELADEQFGMILKAIEKRKIKFKEDWLIVLTTDHGGHRYGHSDDIPEVRSIFIIVQSDEIKIGQISTQLGLEDIAPTVLKHLNIPVDSQWQWDGQSIL